MTTDTSPPPVFRLSLLGGFALTGPDGPVDLPSKKLAGLLAYLALVGPDPQSRERLVTLFWGSHFEAQARQNLRKALSRLRRVLGQDAFVSVREAISLAPGVVACDAVRLQSLIRDTGRASLAEAALLYKGPLLSDVSIAEDAWTEWLDIQRRHIENLALDAMVSLGEQELQAGNHEQALAAASRAVAVNELREDAHRVIVQTLAAAGRKAEALKHFQDLAALLKRELDTEPDTATKELVGALGTQPPARLQNVDEITKPATPEPDHPPPAAADVMRDSHHGITSRSHGSQSDEANSAAQAGSSPERRQLTVMVCNMVGSAPPSADLDPEELSDRIAPFHKMVTDLAARFKGFAAQYSSDGVVVYFGYPSANEHDAEQAVRAGLVIIDSIRKLKSFGDGPLQARAGIATGQVVVGEQPGIANVRQRVAIGEAPNLAAQLQAAAAPGQVLIAASTRRLVGRMFDCRAVGGDELRGFLSPVEAWQVRGEAVGVSRFDARRAGELSPLVGRQEEMELLLRRWEQAKLGEGRVVLLSGEPGIGKSRLAESLLHSLADEPHARLRYFCSPHHTHSPLYPFIMQLERAASFESGESVETRLDKLEALLKPAARNVPQDLALIAELLAVPLHGRYPAVDVSPQQKREMTLNTLLDQFDGVTAMSAALIVVEDIHWIDPTSLDLLDRMIARADDRPVLLIVTFRPELQPTWVGQPNVTMLPLSRLGRRDSAGIVGGVARGLAMPRTVVEQVLAHTDGVPLFIEELTRALLESAVLRETTDAYVLDGPLPPLAIPTTLQASLVARLDRLTAGKEVAQIGAAIGREFSHELIAPVSGLAPEDLDTALEQLTSAGLITRRGTPPAATYSFKHALVQEAAYATLLRSRRRQLHASIANVLVDQYPAMVERLPEVVARHFAEAGAAEEAVGYWRTAGQIATARSANHEAVKFFEQALRALDELPESRPVLEQGFDIRLDLRRVLIQLGEVRRVLEQLRQAETLAEKLNDDYRRGRVCAFMTNVHGQLGELDEPLAWGRRALAIARTLRSPELRILTTTFLEMVHYYRGEYSRVVELATENLASVPADQVFAHFGATGPASVFDRHCLVMSLAQLGRFAEATKYETEAIRLAESIDHAFTRALAHFPSHTHEAVKGDWVTASARLEHEIAMLRANDLVLLLPTSVACSTWVLAQVGQADEALTRLRESERLLEREISTGYVPYHGWSYHALGRACLLLDRLDEAEMLARRALECSTQQPGFAAHATHLLGDIASHPGCFAPQVAEAHYGQALVLGKQRDMRPLMAQCHFGLGKLYLRTGEPKRAYKQLGTATAMYRDMDMQFWLGQAEAEVRQLG
jgi:class 3 adenylate cyclase/DNA-binding SARP family transcriptional activator